MKKLFYAMAVSAFTIVSTSIGGCGNKNVQNDNSGFITVKDGKFYDGDSVYRYIGTNMWYGPILGSTGQGGDRERLARELDSLKTLGITNLRVLVGADGREDIFSHVRPVLQKAPGVYNDTLLDGLDYFMAELEKRDMKAVLYINNAWEWSGGYGAYLEWAGEGDAPDPNADSYQQYVDYVAKFVSNDKAKKMAADHVKFIVGRTNKYTGKPYSDSKAIMSWQIANEPRAFARDSVTKANFRQWIADQAALIKSIDPNHLVSTGSEGEMGCELDIELWKAISSDPNVDYANIHIWPFNWQWVSVDRLTEGLDSVYSLTRDYVLRHGAIAKEIGKPLVLEEFGYPRDGKKYTREDKTTARDSYYDFVLGMLSDSTYNLAGINFWAWGGDAEPKHERWIPFDPYVGDPAQEPQGYYCVFDTDSTISIIRKHIKGISK